MALERIDVVARLAGVGETTLRRWAREGRLTAARSGRAWLLDPVEAQELAALRGSGKRLPRSDRGTKRSTPDR